MFSWSLFSYIQRNVNRDKPVYDKSLRPCNETTEVG